MTVLSGSSPARAVRIAGWLMIGGFVAYLLLVHWIEPAAWTVLVAAALYLVVRVAQWWVTDPPSRWPGVLAVVGAALVVGAVIYLNALPDDGADIPLAGVGGLVLGLCLAPVAASLARDHGTVRPAAQV